MRPARARFAAIDGNAHVVPGSSCGGSSTTWIAYGAQASVGLRG